MKNKVVFFTMLVLAMLMLAACGGGAAETPAEPPIGDAANGEKLFTSVVVGPNGAPGCITCHSLEPDVVIVGPSQAGLGTRAATRKPGTSAEDYIRESIVNPDAYTVEGFAAGLMYQNYGTDLTETEINDIIAYTLTLK